MPLSNQKKEEEVTFKFKEETVFDKGWITLNLTNKELFINMKHLFDILIEEKCKEIEKIQAMRSSD